MTDAAETVADLLGRRASSDPDEVVLRVGDGATLSLGQWARRSQAVASGLVEKGLVPGERVALIFSNQDWVDYAVSYLGVLEAGGTAVPLGTRFTGPELQRVLEHAEPSGVVNGTGAPAAAGGPVRWTADVASLEGGRTAHDIPVRVEPGDLAEILYTSGTTGTPKGVACFHANLMVHDLPADAAAAPEGQLSFLHAFPIGTQAGQEALRVPLRIAGRTCIALPTFNPDAACALIARHRVTRLQLVPAMAQLLVASGAPRRYDVSSVRRIILSSSPAPPALFARLAGAFPEATLWNAYALTEAGAARTLTQYDPARPAAVGRPVGETQVRITDPAGGEVATGEVGEIRLRRPGSPPRRYFRDPAATAETFVDGWVRTGDLGRLDGEGNLHLAGRSKDLIISGGSNVSPLEVENALYEHPAVVEAAVFGIPHAVLGEDVAAAVVVRSPTTDRELQDVVRARLAEHKVPHRVLVVDRLPHNASGKVLKGELRARYGTDERAGTGVAPRDGTETVVASVWAAVLGVPEVGADDDFFALGGHSLAAAQIAARLQDAFGVPVEAGAVFEAPTVAELAGVLKAAGSAATAGTAG